MADVPNAELVCLRQDSQWQMYRASGAGVGVWKRTAPHWHWQFIVSVIVIVIVGVSGDSKISSFLGMLFFLSRSDGGRSFSPGDG